VEKIPRRARDEAHDLELRYFGCGPMTLLGAFRALGLEDEGALRASMAMVGGMAGNGETCGALVGALMVVGYVYGRRKLVRATPETEGPVLELGSRVIDRFRSEFGSINCRDIQRRLIGRAYNLRDTEEVEELHSSRGVEVCAEVIGRAAEIATEVVLEGGFVPPTMRDGADERDRDTRRTVDRQNSYKQNYENKRL
jgi:C_GCAxxG_C_C family probable redox protein